MNMLGICAVFCLMIIYAVDVCDAECDEYVVVFEEITCPSHVKLTPLKRRDINWDKVEGYPCNSTDKTSGKKTCVVEFDCLGTQGSCQSHIKKVNHQTHSFIDNHTAKPITSTTEALDVPQRNITVDKEPHHTVEEESNTSTYDVNLIYIKDNDIQKSSLTTTKNCTLQCDYAETVCTDGERPENYSLSDVKNVHTLEIAINRDDISSVQPLFTGYFPEHSNDSSKNYKNHFKDLKTVTLTCLTLKYNNCKQNVKSSKQINVYIKANFVENNTITKYPKCTKNSITSENVLNLECEDILFAEHNPQIVQTPPTPPPKQGRSPWHCQITEFKYILSSKEQPSENSKIHFINCSNETNISKNKNKYEDINVTPISDGKTIIINNILTKNGTKMDKTEISTGKIDINIDPSSQKNPENIITILITEKSNNCRNKSYFNINEGKIIDLGINKEKILQYNNVELILSNCINVSSSTINETQPHPKVELSIILKNESLNNSNLKKFNGTSKDESVKRRTLLRCDHPNLDLSSNTTSNKTVLQCESIDLDLYNITGIEITPLNQTSNNNTATGSQNKTKQELASWSCQILELNDSLSSKEQPSEKSKLYFKNCANDVSIIHLNSNNTFLDNNVTPTSDGHNKTIDSTKDVIKRNKIEMPSGKLELNKDNLSHINPESMIKIAVTEKANNCRNNSSLNIDEGKIIDLGANISEKKFKLNNFVELKISSCIDVNSSIKNETQPNSKVELTIILKSESLNDSNLKQFNGTAKVGSVKQRILLRCDHPNVDSSNTVLHCESIDLNYYNITGLEISTNVSPTLNANNTKEKKKENLKMDEENHNQTKVYTEINKNNNFSTNKTVEKNGSPVNNKSNENNIKIVDNKEVQKYIPEGNENDTKVVRNKVQKNISESNEKSKTLTFNRKKDIPTEAWQNGLDLANPETERILLIALMTVASVAILIVIALRACPEKREYNPTPTREPPDEEETAF